MRGASAGCVTVAAHLPSRREAPKAMLYAAIDIHKRVFHAAVLDVETGETSERHKRRCIGPYRSASNANVPKRAHDHGGRR